MGPNRATRTFNGKSYSSYPIKKFFEKVKTALNKLPEGAEVSFEDKTLQTQWEEMCAAIDTLDTATIVAFSKAFEIQGNQLGLLDTEHELITSLAMFFYLCNSQIAPSEIWREGFKCVPDHTSPYCWRDENGNIVLRFERIASPIREAMHEKYYRQPILFRWLCNSEWLKETLCKHNLHLRYVSRLESIP